MHRLGPPNPGSTAVAQETLDFRWAGFSPAFLLLMPTFLLPYPPPALAGPASTEYETLLYRQPYLTAFDNYKFNFNKSFRNCGTP